MSSAVSILFSGAVFAISRTLRSAHSSAFESFTSVRYGPSKMGGSAKRLDLMPMRPRLRGWLLAISIDAMP